MTTTNGSMRIHVPCSLVQQYLDELSPELRIHCEPAEGARFTEVWKVRWEPGSGSILPSFQGDLTITPDETSECSTLRLEGSFVRPLGLAHVLLDAAVEPKIAAATARSLLSDIAVEVEARYDREAEKTNRIAP